MSSEPPSPIITALESEAEYVLGFPVYVAMTIGVSPQDASHNALPLPHTHSPHGAIGLRLWRDAETEPFASDEPTAFVDPDLGRPGFGLRAGELRRFLLEISPLLPPALAAGDYGAELLYGGRQQAASSPRFALRLRAPSDRERETLTALQDELSAAGSWGAWAEQRAADPSALRPPSSPRDPLRYPRALKYLLYGAVPLGMMDDGFLTALDGPFAADAEGFRGEILAAKDPARFQAHAQQVKAKWPGLAAWMDAIANGATEIVWARTQG